MTSGNEENETAAIVRALITTRGQNGATLDEIKADYKQQIGESLSPGGDYFELQKWLQNDKNVRMEWRAGKMVYFSEVEAHQHLVQMVGTHKKTHRGKRKPKVQKGWLNNSLLYDDTTQTTPKTWTNSLVFRRSRRSRGPRSQGTFQSQAFSANVTNTQTPDQPIVNQAPPEAPKLPAPKDDVSNERENMDESNMIETQDHSTETEADSGHHSIASSLHQPMEQTNNFFASYFDEIDVEVNPCVPEFYKCLMVGDNFFLNLAVMNLGYRMINANRILQSGLCISGQTIAETNHNIRKLAPNQIILLNIGSVDIAQGRELVDMVLDMLRLLKTCINREITPILTTVVPLINYRLGNRASLTNSFNDFIVKNPFNFPVIELHKTFVNNHESLEPQYYQSAPRFVSGTRKPLVFWTRLGRQKILKTLTQELGSAILKILFK